MREERGDLFVVEADAIVIPINWRTKVVERAGIEHVEAVMGAGVALQAKKRWPALPFMLGAEIRGSRIPFVVVYTAGPDLHIACFATKLNWRDPSDVDLIASNLPWLVSHADIGKWQTIALPRLGCGNGGLDWAVQVRPLLADVLDDRFVVIHPEGMSDAR